MKAALLSAMVAVSALAIFVDCRVHVRVARDTTVTCQDVAKQMLEILTAMIKKGPTTDNPNLNTFITVISEAGNAAAKSPTLQVKQGQFTKITIDGFTALCAATKTSPANKALIVSLLIQTSQISLNANIDTFLKMMSQTVCYLGDGTAASKEYVSKMFMSFLINTPAIPAKATTANAGSESVSSAEEIKAIAAKPAPAKAAAPAKTPAKTTANAPAKTTAKAPAKTSAKAPPKTLAKAPGKTPGKPQV